MYFCFCATSYGGEFSAQGETPKEALDAVISLADDLTLSTAVFYKAERLNLRVDTSPVIVPTD